MLGGVTWRKRSANLTDEVPRRSPVARLRISIVIRPSPKCGVRRRRARGMPWLSLLGDYSVSGGGLLEIKRTHRRERVDESHGTGPVSPRVSTAKVLPGLVGGKAHVYAKNRLYVMRLQIFGW